MPHDLAQPALESIAINGGMLMPRHDEADPPGTTKGSERSDLES
jgi:hypothetical protein